MENNRFIALLDRFSTTKIAVLGDFFLDNYIQLDRSLSEFSIETHKEAFQVVGLRAQPGAAGVVTNNLHALGAITAAIGYTGDDGNGYALRQALKSGQIITEHLITAPDRFTPTYTKPIMKEVSGENIELNRMDIINRSPNSQEINNALADQLTNAASIYDGVLVVEQVQEDGFGTMSPFLREKLVELSLRFPQKAFIVDSRHFAGQYDHVSLKMNYHEAAASLGINTKLDASQPASQTTQLLWNKQQKPIFITLGSQGICGFEDGEYFNFPGFPISGPIDIVGAGDSVLAGVGISLCAGATAKEAAYIGNLVGSITVQQIGTTGIATKEDIVKRHQEYQNIHNL
jgi:rfaE bifunctional protein kinase chain/domain